MTDIEKRIEKKKTFVYLGIAVVCTIIAIAFGNDKATLFRQ
jgi:hypothetical protein